MAGEKSAGAKAVMRAAIALVFFCLFALAIYLADEGSRYLWIKSLHIMAVISWMAGMFYLPRLFIYHLDHEAGTLASETFKTMERRLYRAIMTPAMVLTWIFGLWLAIAIFSFQGGWLHIKLTAVVIMTLAHFYMGKAIGAFQRDERPGSGKFWRLFNEVPTILMIAIVLMVVFKPFS